MRIRFLGAASAVALLSFGLAACGQNDTYSDTAADETTTTTETADATDTTDQSSPYAANEPDPAAEDPYAAPGATSPASPTDTTTAATDTTGYGASTAGDIIDVADITSKGDAERVASEAFDKADADGDGSLTRTEYMELAMSADQFSAGAASPIDETQTDEAMGEGDVDTADPSQAGMPADAAATVDNAFAEAAGDDGTLTKDELRAAFLARFDQADADGDAQLDDAERQTFAALTAGGQ